MLSVWDGQDKDAQNLKVRIFLVFLFNERKISVNHTRHQFFSFSQVSLHFDK